MDTDQAVALSSEAIKTGLGFLGNIEPMEALFVAGIFALGIAMGTLIDRLLDRIPKRGWILSVIDFLSPLMQSLITIALLVGFTNLFADKLFKPHLLPLAIKCAVSWFAIRLVLLISKRRTAAAWFIALVIIPVTVLHLFEIWEPITKTLQSWKFTVGAIDLNAYSILRSLVTVAALFWTASFISNVTENRLNRIRSMRASNRMLIMKIFQIVLYFTVFLIGLHVVGVSITALSVFGGALGVGIGFGLQKIASNFISGIILLFERSIQVNDLVELQDGTSGYIRHTGARYTLLETFDGKEVLIPNEDFITQRTTNWTYSNRRARVEIRVGIGYECDMRLAQSIMLEEAKKHPRCISEPGAACFIDGFGDNSINLVLYFWVSDVTDGRLEPRSDVIVAIWESFKASGITIPYPQRDVHLFYKPDAGQK